jgi:dTDP-4-amino-4,6-dideoxygalactose transaminase
MGLAVLPYMDEIIKGRKLVIEAYNNYFENHLQIKPLEIRPETEWNHSYYPVLFENEESLIAAENELKANDILARRYFYPSLSELDYVNSDDVEIASNIASKILCLPLYYNLSLDDLSKVVSIIIETINVKTK